MQANTARKPVLVKSLLSRLSTVDLGPTWPYPLCRDTLRAKLPIAEPVAYGFVAAFYGDLSGAEAVKATLYEVRELSLDAPLIAELRAEGRKPHIDVMQFIELLAVIGEDRDLGAEGRWINAYVEKDGALITACATKVNGKWHFGIGCDEHKFRWRGQLLVAA